MEKWSRIICLFCIPTLWILSFVVNYSVLPFDSSRASNILWRSFHARGPLRQNNLSLSHGTQVHYKPDCRSMFEIGWKMKPEELDLTLGTNRLNEFLTKLMKKKEENVQVTDDYIPLARALPPMVTGSEGNLSLMNESRLTQLNGKLPYLPCAIRMYSTKEIKKCVHVRRQKKKSFWIVFFGDSRMRNKFDYFTSSTHLDFDWLFRSGNFTDKFMTMEEEKKDQWMFPYANREATSKSGARVTFICSRQGLPDSLLLDWASKRRWPDLLIIEFGLWNLLSYPMVDFKGKDLHLSIWSLLVPHLQKLKENVTMVVAAQTRQRLPFLYARKFMDQKDFWPIIQSDFLRRVQSDFIDQTMRIAMPDEDFIFWDSTLPFNLASTFDCLKLIEANHSVLWTENTAHVHMAKFMCFDGAHRTSDTIQDEFHVIMNFMCNKHMASQSPNNLCCS